MENESNIFNPIKRDRAFETVSNKIKELIFSGSLKPGEKLPPEAQLAEQFNVGRQTVREAMRLLEISGFISVKKGGNGGPIIEDTLLNTIGRQFLDAFRMKKISLNEITIARLEIEKVVLGYVIDNADDSDIKKLQDNVLRAKAKIENRKLATEENTQFHSLLAEASKNHVFVIAVDSIMALLRDHLRLGPDIETSADVVAYHETILNAIINKNRSEALRTLENHLFEVKSRLTILEQ